MNEKCSVRELPAEREEVVAAQKLLSENGYLVVPSEAKRKRDAEIRAQREKAKLADDVFCPACVAREAERVDRGDSETLGNSGKRGVAKWVIWVFVIVSVLQLALRFLQFEAMKERQELRREAAELMESLFR